MKLYRANEKVVANGRALWQQALADLGARDERIVALTADLSRSVCTEQFRKQYPERFFNMGIAEQNMIGTAAGMALSGKIPYCASFAPFLTMRALEQFRTDVCYMNLPVRLVGSYGGIAITGPSHSGLEDAGIVRGLAGAAVVCPSDTSMVSKVFEASLHYKGPLFIRLGEGSNDSQIYAEDYVYQIGKAITAREGCDITIITFGQVLKYAVDAAEMLKEQGVDAAVLDMHTLKPFDAEAVVGAARRTGAILTVEDHSIYNGLGSAVAEVLAEGGLRCRFKRLGIPDIYPCYGPSGQLHTLFGYDADGIAAAARQLLDRPVEG
ncbi:transketolase C-terminal domain-containing protein [Agathobaculum sp. NTUH-O15-33]|uniref:transketolase family protein n=1 Tax=Agathobaculum sp. NTUH-O15-33 TaxID=3079302 RepID=UPI002958CE74|nr:transketolase C-terminal domain-containing protein [Agathobaculum sp. NTUH-O15-33]WNX85713.1 transketolase C-terminal domain-containing protein [Agathobaculum sp. NTUH-O15-33]